jgi:hypothetical protein
MKSSPKRPLALKWACSGVLVLSLHLGCGPAGELPPDPALEHQHQAAEETARPVLRVESLEAIGLDNELSANTKSLLRARLAKGQESLFKEVPLPSDADDGKPTLLRDDGTEGDEKAGDGIFSAIGFVDFDTLRKEQERIASFQEESKEPLTWATFDNREVVSERVLSPLLPDRIKPGIPVPLTPVGITLAVKPASSLVITHSAVVNDASRTYNPCTNTGNPSGVWTFNHLMTQMANGLVPPAVFTEQWLKLWTVPQSINGWTVPARTSLQTQILNSWPRVNGQLDMTKAPFKLVAIVNRLDLGKGAGPAGYGGGGRGGNNGGELRFVFAAVNRTSSCTQQPFLIIFEYGVPKSACAEVRTWAQQWLNLSSPSLPLGSAAYNAALTALTQQVVVANAAPAKPNGSAINQIRTNEIMLASPWELREFRFDPASATPNLLTEGTVALTPGDALNNTSTLANFINANTAAILANTYSVPTAYPTSSSPFLGANPKIPTPSTTWWKAQGIANNTARHKFSLNTCNSCHGRETSTSFTHIAQNGALSGFLATGMSNPNTPFNVPDPFDGTVRSFFEIRDRAQHLDSVANQSCLMRVFDLPLLSPH